jgi:hypothetical protein
MGVINHTTAIEAGSIATQALCASRVHPEFLLEGVADPEVICNLNFILKTMLQKYVINSNITCLQLHLYTYKYNYMFHDSLT